MPIDTSGLPFAKPQRKEKVKNPLKKVPKESVPDEANEQMAVVDWLRWHNIRFTATANGIYTHPVSMSRMKRLGVAVGLPDILVFDHPPFPGRNIIIDADEYYCGCAIEMKKRKGGIVSEEQKEWIAALKELGWVAKVCLGCDDAIAFLKSLGYGGRK